MKKWIALLLAAMMLLSLCACGEDEKSISDAANGQTVNEPATEPAPAPEPEPEPKPEPEVEMTTI